MPIRIPDYPDSFAGWNAVSSYGSIISVMGTCLFIYIVYDIFSNSNINNIENNESIENENNLYEIENKELNWSIPGYLVGNIEFNKYGRFSSNLEWSLITPTPLHAYESLPAQTYSLS